MAPEKPQARPWSLRRKLLLFGAAAIIILGLALGLGLGLTLGRDDNDDSGGDDNGATPTTTASPLPTPTGTLRWTPNVNDTWQIVLQSGIQLDASASSVTPNVSVYDIDLFDNSKETIDALHALGKKVICYFSGGSYEPNRPDSKDFEQGDMGKTLDGWPDEKWLKLGSENVRKIMKGRVELAREKGCDGVDPDNVDGYVSLSCYVWFSSAELGYLLLHGVRGRMWRECRVIHDAVLTRRSKTTTASGSLPTTASRS